jgi:hypothetical protein
LGLLREEIPFPLGGCFPSAFAGGKMYGTSSVLMVIMLIAELW